jgi:hypothetical protein
MPSNPSPLRAVGRGLLAGAAGTAALTAFQAADALRKGSTPRQAVVPEVPESWQEAPAPARVGFRFLHGLFDRNPAPDHAPALANAVHWAYGTVWGGLFGVLQGTVHGPVVPTGAALGTTVFGASYVALPAMEIYRPPWQYPGRVLAKDWSYHLVYGLGVAAAYRLLEARDGG